MSVLGVLGLPLALPPRLTLSIADAALEPRAAHGAAPATTAEATAAGEDPAAQIPELGVL